MDISVHKCKHSGNLHFSFYQLDSKNQFDDCCCKSETKEVEAQKVKSCCESENNETAKPLHKAIEKKQESTEIHSCCSKAKKAVKKKPTLELSVKTNISQSTKTITKVINCENGISKPTTCCDISKVAFSLTSAQVPVINTEKTIKESVYIPNLSLITFIGYQTSDKSTSLKIDYPLKEPVNKIIAFISLQSNQKDDSDSHS